LVERSNERQGPASDRKNRFSSMSEAAASSESTAVQSVDELRAVGPYVVQGLVVPGFTRGSKELGIPTGADGFFLCHCLYRRHGRNARFIYTQCVDVSRAMLCLIFEITRPTANLDPAAFKAQIDGIPAGIYFGWATIDRSAPYKAVLSIGWNPFYGNKEKTVEPHLVHKFDADFYGATMRLCICGWIRPEKNFASLGAPATLQ
jgi:FAD synthase